MRKILLVSVACFSFVTPSHADKADGIVALSLLIGMSSEDVVSQIGVEYRDFIDSCTDQKIDRWRKRGVTISLKDAKQLEDECVVDAVNMEYEEVKAKQLAAELADKKAWADEEAMSARLAASHKH
jgi:hypothetical protein